MASEVQCNRAAPVRRRNRPYAILAQVRSRNIIDGWRFGCESEGPHHGTERASTAVVFSTTEQDHIFLVRVEIIFGEQL